MVPRSSQNTNHQDTKPKTSNLIRREGVANPPPRPLLPGLWNKELPGAVYRLSKAVQPRPFERICEAILEEHVEDSATQQQNEAVLICLQSPKANASCEDLVLKPLSPSTSSGLPLLLRSLAAALLGRVCC